MKQYFSKYSTLFMQIFSSIVIIAFAVIVIMATVISLWFRNEIVKELNEQKQMSLNNIDQTISHYEETSNKAIQLLVLDPIVRSVLYDYDSSWSKDIYTVSNTINGILTINPFIESISLLRVDQSLMKFSNKVHSSQFEDKIYELINEGKQNVYWKDKSTKGTINNYHSIIIGDRYPNVYGYDTAVILTVNVDEVARQIFLENSRTNEKTIVVNKDYQIIMSNDMSLFTKYLTDEDLMAYNEDTNKFRLFSNQKDYFVSVYKSAKGYSIINKVDQPLGVNRLLPIILAVGAIGLVVFILANALALLLARRIYKPINTIFTNLRNLFSNEAVASSVPSSELQQLSRCMTNAIKMMHDYDKKEENDSLRDLLSKEEFHVQDTEIDPLLKKMKLFDGDDQCFMMAILRICHYKEFKRQHTKESLAFQLNSIQILWQSYSNPISNKTYQINRQEFIVVFKGGLDTDLTNEKLVLVLESFISYVKESLDVQLVAGMSQVYVKSGLIQKAYNDALEQIERSFVRVNPMVITGNDLVDSNKYKDEFQKAISACIEFTKEVNRTHFIVAFRKVLEVLQYKNYDEIVQALVGLALKMKKIKDYLLEIEDSQYAKYYDEIMTIKEVETLESYFLDIFDDIKVTMLEYREKNVNNLIDKAIDYVNNHYNDFNLSANQLAATLGVTPVYFGKLFQNTCQQSFPNYVNHLRLEKAHMLLKENTEMDIMDICTEVGFSSASYFSSKFKKKYGFTPSKYRLNIRYHDME